MVLKKAAQAEESQFYIYENADGEGWVMVAANDVVKPILAYSETGMFRTDNMPSNVTHWLGHYDKFIKKLEDEGVTQTEEAAAQWKALRKAPPSTAKGNIVVDMMIQTQWDQDAPYNDLCPGSGSNKAYTGCVATAMAQVMNYWQWPITGNSSRTYQPMMNTYDDDGNFVARIIVYQGNLTADFGNTTYDWANMKKKHYTSDSQAQKTAISTLMYHCGVATDMMYGGDAYDGSGTYTVNYGDWNWSDSEGDCAQNAFYNFFRYKKPTGYIRDGYGSYYSSWTDAKWTAMIKAELDAGRPIMYAGAGSAGGHSFICDGYDDQNYFHFNWGWSGSNDGWYTLSNLVPGSGGAGGGSYSFSEDQDVIIGIEPIETGHKVVLNGTGCTLSADSRVENGKSLTVAVTPTDATYDYKSATVKLGSTTLNSPTHYTLSSDNKTLTVKSTAITGDLSNDLTITILWEKKRYSYSFLGTNCTDEELEGMLNMNNASLSLTVTPNSGFSLADEACWTVEMGNNILTYGDDFTYNSSTNTFSITTVTGDVTILAEAGRPVTWRANGNIHATNVAVNGKITLPANPEDCSESKKFVGWCTNGNYSHATTAPSLAKDGDNYTVATYYAVYATAGSGGSSTISKASSIAVGDEVVLVYETGKMELSSFSSSSTIYGIGSSYSTSPSGSYSFNVVTGSSAGTFAFERDGKYWNWSSGNSLNTSTSISESSSWTVSFSSGNAIIANVGTTNRTIRWNTSSPRFACYTSGQADVQLYKKSGGTSYSDYSTTCTTCTLSSIALNTSGATTVFTQGDAFSAEGLVVTASYSDCSDRAVTPTSISSPDMSTTGEKTITVSYTEGEVTQTNTYTISVNAAPTYKICFYDGETKLKEEDLLIGATATPPSNPAGCTDYTFYGWWIETLGTSNTTAHKVTDFTVSGAQDYYAVYSHSTGGGGSTTATYGFEDTDDATKWDISAAITKDAGAKSTGTYGGIINTNHTYVAYTDKVKVTNFSFQLKRTSNNSNYYVYVETSANGTDWTTAETYGMGTFNNGSFTSKSKDFDGETALYVRFHCYNTTAVRHVDNFSITYGGGGTTYYTTTKDCTIPTEVTVKFDANGGEGTMTDQTIEYNTATALKANTFERTGYTFLGWATSSTGEKVYDDEEEVTLTQKETTLYAVWQANKHNVTFSQPESGGTFTVNSSSSPPVANVDFGSTVTIAIMPTNSHFTVNTVTVSGVSGSVAVSGEGNTRTFTMPDEDVTVSVTFTEETKYIVNWYVADVVKRAEENYAGEVLTGLAIAPTSADCDGSKVFVGWTAHANYEDESNEPDDLFTDLTGKVMPVNGTNYYAVFATETTNGSGSTTVDDAITLDDTGVSGTSYSAWTNLSKTSDAVYAGNNAGGNSAIQLRTNNSNSGIVSTTSGGKIKKVVIAWNSNTTAGRIVDVYGSTSAYTAATNLYATATQGTLLGSLSYDDNETELTISGDYDYVGLRSRSGALYLNSVTFTWSTGSGSSTETSDYSTSCTHEDQITITFNENGGSGTMAAQVMNWGEATALNANTFTAPIGHHFLGWSESSTATTATYTDQESVTYKKDVTLYAVWEVNSHNVTFTTPVVVAGVNAATVTVNGSSTSPLSTVFNSTVTVTVAPADHYSLTGITLSSGGSVTIDGNSGTFTMPDEDVTVTVTMKEDDKYTVTWDVAGTTSTETHYAGVALEGIPAPTSDDCDGLKKFVGWTATANYSSEDIAPDDLFTDPATKTTPDNNTTTYYAVFAEEEEGGSGSGEDHYELVSSISSDLTGSYLLSDGTHTATGYSSSTLASVTLTPGSTRYPDYEFTITKGTGDYAEYYTVTDASNNDIAGKSSSTDLVTSGTGYLRYWSISTTAITNASTGRHLGYNNTSAFKAYASSNISINAPAHLYKWTGSSTTYSGYTTTCGAAISAKNIGWITAAKGQKVKRVINVSAKGFDEATTLTASSGDAQFKVTLGASAVPAGKTGLSTTLTVEYTPTISDNRIADVELTLSAGGITQTITVSGRSLPDEFLAITKKNDTWYALPANMNGGENQYEGVIVTPDDDSEPTMVAVAPSTIVYSLRSADNSRYAENGAYVRMAGNGGKALWGNTTADALTIQNSETIDMANAENYEWSLHTTDGIHYTIANPHHADYASGRVLAYGDKFGLYKTSTEFFLVPTGCNSQPQEVNVSARRADATFSWVSNASSVTIALYTDEEKTAFAKSATATSVPYYMTDLTEKTHYWFTLTPDGETACAVSGEFETTGPTIDVVEWKVDTAVVFVDKEEHFNPVVIIDGEVEHGAGTGNVATELFFSKYFEGAGSMKLVSIFNGTKEDIDLTNYSIYVRMRGSSGNWSGSSNDVTLDLSGLGSIASGQEIIFFSRPMGTETELTSCSNTFLNDKVTNCSSVESNPRWIECDGTTYKRINFNGNDPIMLRKSGTLIDIIGSEGAAPTSKNCLNSNNERGWAGTVKNMDKGKSPSDPAFDAFYEASSKTPVTTQDSIDLLADFGINLTADEIDITTARCILFRDKRVVSGDSAVLMNGSTFVTFTIHDSFHSEWSGRSVCMDDAMKTAAGVENDAQATCNSYQDLSEFNYSNYYKDWQTIEDPKTLNEYTHNEETGTYEIPIPNLAQYSCLNIRFQLQNDAGEVVTEAPVQVPIIVTGNHQTIDDIFNEIVKTDGGDPLYTESINRCKTCDVVVLGKGVLTKATDGTTHDVPEVGDVKVYPGGKLIVPTGTSYSVNSLAFRRQEDAVPTADIQGNLNIKADGKNVYFDLRIDPTNWHYISLPYNCNVSDIRFVGEEIKIPILGTDYLLKYYDGEKRAATQSGGCWEMVAPDGVLKKGIGYIFGIPGTGKVQREFRFPMSNTIIDEEKNPEGKLASGVYAYGGDKDMTEVRANHRGWNLIGDPYLLPYSSDIADPVMTGYIVPDYPEDPEEQWDGHYKFADDARSDLRYIVEPVDNGRSEYIQVAITDYEMKPFTSYFVQIGGSNPEAEQGVQFNLSAVERSASPVRRAPAEYEEQEDTHPVWCAVTIISPKGEKDETTMLISDKFTDGYDMMDDLVKMRGTYYQYVQITTKPVLASRNNEGEMAFNALPDASAEAGIPLHYFAATQGEYVIAYNDKYGRDEIQAVMLLDKQTNEWHDLMNEPYTFYTNRTDDKNRFVLTVRVERKKEPQITTDIDATSSTDDRPRKILHNDHIYILRGDKIYDITGKQMLNR